MLRPHGVDGLEKIGNDVSGSGVPYLPDGSLQEPVTIPSSESPSSSSSEDTEDGDERLTSNTSNQLVLYDSKASGAQEIKPLQSQRPSGRRFFSSSKTLPSIGAFTVQCAKCFKWRLIPSKQKYEEIREHILETPFFCETAREWRPDVSCDDPADLSQDGTRVWAIDKPNISKPPPGWQRLLHIRGEGSTKFADVYYVTPSGKKLRSMVEVQKFLTDHPEFMTDGVTLSRFSFQIPRPLQENYVRKRPTRLMASCDNTKASEITEASPLAWAAPDDDLTELQLGMPTESGLDPSRETSTKRRKKSQSLPQTTNFNGDTIDDNTKIKLDKAGHSSDVS